MKLLLDQNLSARLIGTVADLYPDSSHVRFLGMSADDDQVIWDYARQHDFVIVSKDTDFYHRSMRFGSPPKVIWLRLGNCSTALIAQLLRDQVIAVHAFADDADAAFLPLG